MRRIVTALLPIALAAAGPAAAAPCVSNFKEMTRLLAQRYGEQAIAEATSGRHALHVFWSSAGTYSVVVTTPHGFACIVAAGQDWEFLKPSPDADAALRMRPAAERLPD